MSRLHEPSTFAGLAAVAQGLKIALPPQWAMYLDAATMFFGSVAAVKRDPGSPR